MSPHRAVAEQQPNPVQRLAVRVLNFRMDLSDRHRKNVGQVFPAWIGFKFVASPRVEHLSYLTSIAVMRSIHFVCSHVAEPKTQLALFQRARRREPARAAIPHEEPGRRTKPGDDIT